MTDIVIGVDLGGTRIKAVAINKDGDILYEHVQPTNDGDDKVWKGAVETAVHKIQSKLQNKNMAIGISAPGLPNSNNSAIAFMPGRMQGLENFNWSDFLSAKTFVLNDAISALMAEARFGVAKKKKM